MNDWMIERLTMWLQMSSGMWIPIIMKIGRYLMVIFLNRKGAVFSINSVFYYWYAGWLDDSWAAVTAAAAVALWLVT